MNKAQFDELVRRRTDKIVAVLTEKRKEYTAGTDDPFHNFRQAGMLLGVSPEFALMGMVSKHLSALLDMAKGDTVPSLHDIDEKVGDIINYMVLQEGILIERYCPEVFDLLGRCKRCEAPITLEDTHCLPCRMDMGNGT